MKADLHIHTKYSDGIYSVAEIIQLAKERNLDVIAITDHDVLKGALVAQDYQDEDIKIIIGMELSTEYNNESIHILGYFPDRSDLEVLDAFLEKQREGRIERAHKIKAKLFEHFNIDLKMDFIESVSSITRGTIAREIIRQGYPYSNQEIFDKMLGNGCPAYLPSTKMNPKFGIKMIHEYGGLAVLAHPVLVKNSSLEEIIAFGIDGIEAIYPANNTGDEARFRRYAKKHKLFITAGSDFHSPNDSKHGNLGEYLLRDRELEIFLNKLTEVKQ
ncbi:MAG TPA: PHP domain-containing protein [Acholeplasmataceae bacterium]|nr:PHP domain-containing protein [Acholeplasmataceae bacterium]